MAGVAEKDALAAPRDAGLPGAVGVVLGTDRFSYPVEELGTPGSELFLAIAW